MDNLAIREFQQTIIGVTNSSPLPIEIKRLVFKEVMQQIETAAEEKIQKEFAEMQAAKAAEEKTEGEEPEEGETPKEPQEGE